MLFDLYSRLGGAKTVLVLALMLLSSPAKAVPFPPPFDFTYAYSDPFAAASQDYIVSTSNARLYDEGFVRMWIPIAGGATQATTTPAVITYKFDFGTETVAEANLRTNNPTFHWSYSQGYNYFYGSKDGAAWTQLLDVTTPAFGTANGGFYNDALPASLLGGTELWFKAELFSFGPNVGCCGAAGRNTAQHSRWDERSPGAETFKLEVNYAAAGPPPGGSVPEPTTMLLMGIGLAGLGFVRRRRLNG